MTRRTLSLRQEKRGFTLIETRQRRTNSRINPAVAGFTLIELMVVVAIISLLASVVFANLQRQRAQAMNAARLETSRSVQTALHLYHLDQNQLPGNWSEATFTWQGEAEYEAAMGELVAKGTLPTIPRSVQGFQYGYYEPASANSPGPEDAYFVTGLDPNEMMPPNSGLANELTAEYGAPWLIGGERIWLDYSAPCLDCAEQGNANERCIYIRGDVEESVFDCPEPITQYCVFDGGFSGGDEMCGAGDYISFDL